MKKTCEHCLRQYDAPPSIKPRFCSSKCSGLFKRKGSDVPCEQCGKLIWRIPSTNQRFCSYSCRTTFRNLSDENPSYHRDVTGVNNPMFGVRRFGKDNPMFGVRGARCSHWKGGRRNRPDGYIRVIAPKRHPHPSEVKNGVAYILEHRLVMEKHIGRFLRTSEIVHHIDENPSNNRIDNLALFPSAAAHARHHATLRHRR